MELQLLKSTDKCSNVNYKVARALHPATMPLGVPCAFWATFSKSPNPGL